MCQCNDIEEVTPVKKGKSKGMSVSVTPDCKASYAAAMKELAESFSPVEEVEIVMFEVVLMLWWSHLQCHCNQQFSTYLISQPSQLK